MGKGEEGEGSVIWFISQGKGEKSREQNSLILASPCTKGKRRNGSMEAMVVVASSIKIKEVT